MSRIVVEGEIIEKAIPRVVRSSSRLAEISLLLRLLSRMSLMIWS